MKAFEENKRIKFLTVLLFASMFVLNGCGSFVSSNTNPAAAPQQQAPPAPIVVDGVRASYADVVEKTSPAVVRIDAQRKAKNQPQQFDFGDSPLKDFIPPQFRQQQPQQRPPVERGLGSGVVVNADGTVLTNHHVIDGAEKITVTMDNNKVYEATIVGSDPPSDLAVLKIEGENLPFLSLGNSDNVRIGDMVLAIGNPLGIGKTVTAGIISAKGRRTGLSDGSFEDFLQTDAPINRGNSGGALVNLTGELIGVNSQIISDSGGGGNIGIGFSIPSNMAKSVMEQLLKDKKVRRGKLGVNIQNVNEKVARSLELKEAKGVIVSNVAAGSAAEKAGIKRGDIITAINGEVIEDSNVLRNKVAGTLPGTEIKVTVLRDGNQENFTATLDEFNVEGAKSDEPKKENEETPAPQKETGKLGLTLQPVTPQIAKQLELPAETQGLVVMEVDPDGASAEEEITRGDVILEINRKPVKSLDEVQAALDKSGSRPILLLVTRRGTTVYLTVTPNQ